MSDSKPNGNSNGTSGGTSSPSLSELLPLEGDERAKVLARAQFDKIQTAVKAGLCKCYNCDYPAKGVAIIQPEGGLLIYAVCPSCAGKVEEVTQRFKNAVEVRMVLYERDGKHELRSFSRETAPVVKIEPGTEEES